MPHNLPTNQRDVKRGITPELTRLKSALLKAGISYWAIALESRCSETYVWMVLNGRRQSPKVMAATAALLAERRAR
jgi:hypothetical protein